MEKILLISVAAMAAYQLAKHFGNIEPMTRFNVIDMKGREYQLNEDKNGYMRDQFGGVWA